jgi:class 3 adenylate cyclase
MDRPRILYVKSSDGVSIAYWTFGEGPPVVWMSTIPFGTSLMWELPEARAWLERPRPYQVVSYDARGTGLSEQSPDYSLEAHLGDLEAVVGRLGLERHALQSSLFLGPAGIEYAARYPDRVTQLVLLNAFASGGDYRQSSRYQAFASLRSLAAQEWELYTRTVASSILAPSAATDAAQALTAALKRSVDPTQVVPLLDASEQFDSTLKLSALAAPTLVVYRRSIPIFAPAVAQRLAAEIPNAELVALEGDSSLPWVGDVDALADAIDSFLLPRGAALGTSVAPQDQNAAVRTILFTDLVASTALTQRLGDAKAQELVRAHNAIVREALETSGGTEIKHTGDGIMASFSTASGALGCATAIQRAVAERDDADLQVHIGLNAGEPVAEESDLFGTSVQLARRICDHAEGGQVLVSEVVRQLAAGKGFLFADIGEVVPKGFEDSVRLYEVTWRHQP